MIREFKVDKDKNKLICILQEINGNLKEISIDGFESGDDLILYWENITGSELTDIEAKQVKEFIKSNSHIIIL